MTANPEPSNFEGFFKQATDYKPYPYQRRLAVDDALPSLINIPIGAGKTVAVILAWLWRRRFHEKGDIRKAIIEADLVDYMVVLPGQLCYSTQIPTCMRFPAKNKHDRRPRDLFGRKGTVT